MHAISSYRGNRPTQTHPPTNRQDRLQYTAAASAQCNYIETVIEIIPETETSDIQLR